MSRCLFSHSACVSVCFFPYRCVHYTCLKPQARLGGSVFKLCCQEGSTLGIELLGVFFVLFFLKIKTPKNPKISVLLKEMALGHEVSYRNTRPPACRLLPPIDDDQKLPFPTAAL